MNSFNFFLYIAFFVIIFLKQANAYLDPGSSNFIIQIIIAAFASLFVTLKLYWMKIKNFFFKFKKKKK